MPPNNRLRPDQIEVFVRRFRGGAYWPKFEITVVREASRPDEPLFNDGQEVFWAFQPFSNPAFLNVEQTEWSQTPIDRFILAAQEAARITPAPPTAAGFRIQSYPSFILASVPIK